MKRIVALILSIVMVVSFCACGNKVVQEGTNTEINENTDVTDNKDNNKDNTEEKVEIENNTEVEPKEVLPYDIQFVGTANDRDVYVVNPQETRGYNVHGFFSVPKKVEHGHLLVIPAKNGVTQAYIQTYAKTENKMLGRTHYGLEDVVNELNAVLLVPVIPEEDMRDGYRVNALDYTTFSDKKYGKFDVQTCKLIDDVLDYLKENLNISLPKEVDMTGYSGEGEFAVRFALLQPQRLHTVCVGGVSWYPAMPITQIDNEESKYPLGTADINKYTNNFDINAWKQIHFYIDQGLQDDRGSYHAQRLEELNWASKLEYPQVWDKTAKLFASLTPNAQLMLYEKVGHSFIQEDYVSFLKANDGDKFVAIKPNRDGSYYLLENGEVKSHVVEKKQGSNKSGGGTSNTGSAGNTGKTGSTGNTGSTEQKAPSFVPIGDPISIPSKAFSVTKNPSEGNSGITDITGTYTKTETGYHFEIKCKKPDDVICKRVGFTADYNSSATDKKESDFSIIEFDWDHTRNLNKINLFFTLHNDVIEFRMFIDDHDLKIER